jgi:alkanesulfonate monooxygenase SsuD/methylene tetrahydromethanopterin reductase-like flavin-dependent oxidoreductase (luciferase family)
VDFDERNQLFDEAIEVLHGVWSTDDFRYEGRHFQARGVALGPPPVQRPHPPLWLGGNAQIVRNRVAAWGQGWAPLVGGAYSRRTTRTRSIESDEDLAALIREIGDGMDAVGRDRSELDVLAASATPLSPGAGREEQLDAIGRLGEIGVTWTHFPFPRNSFAEALDALQAYGAAIVGAARLL